MGKGLPTWAAALCAILGVVCLGATDRRSVLVKVLTTAEEYKLLQAAAAQSGLSLSAWLRAVGLATARQGAV